MIAGAGIFMKITTKIIVIAVSASNIEIKFNLCCVS